MLDLTYVFCVEKEGKVPFYEISNNAAFTKSNTSGPCDDDHTLKLSEMCCFLRLWYFLMPSFLLCQFTLFAIYQDYALL